MPNSRASQPAWRAARYGWSERRIGHAGFGVATTHAAVTGAAADAGADVGGGAAAGLAAADADVDVVAAGLVAGLAVQVAEVGGRGIQSVDAAGEGGVAFYRELEAAVAGFQAALFGHAQVVAIDAGVAGTDAAAGAPRPGGDAKAGVLLAAVVAATVLQAIDAQLAADVAGNTLPAGDGALQRSGLNHQTNDVAGEAGHLMGA